MNNNKSLINNNLLRNNLKMIVIKLLKVNKCDNITV